MKKIGLSRSNVVALFLGMLMPLAFAPFYFWPLAFICPSILLLQWNNVSPKKAAIQGLFFGLGFFSIGISWVYNSLHVYGQASVPLAGFITALFIGYLSLFFMGLGYSLNRLCPTRSAMKNLLIFPVLWVIFELLRTWLFTGFPWLLLGYSQTTTWLRGFAAIVGVYGISFIVVFINGMLVRLYENRQHLSLTPVFSILGIVIAGWFLSSIHWTDRTGQPLKITMIQGNIKQELKWQIEQFQNSLWLYGRHTQAHWDSDLIIWPEAAITLPLHMAKEITEELNTAAQQHHSTIITGIPVVKPGEAYNAMIALGAGSGIYYKRHLVPFGEYIPLRPVFTYLARGMQIPMSDSLPGPQKQDPLNANGVLIAPYICYEVAYPIEFLMALPQAQLLLTITDDSWFGHSIAAAQHIQMSQMRSMETGRYMLFSSNTGITAVIDPMGNISKSIPTFKESDLTATVYPMRGSTPWMILRLYPFYLLVLVLVLSLGFRKVKSASYRSCEEMTK